VQTPGIPPRWRRIWLFFVPANSDISGRRAMLHNFGNCGRIPRNRWSCAARVMPEPVDSRRTTDRQIGHPGPLFADERRSPISTAILEPGIWYWVRRPRAMMVGCPDFAHLLSV
ncbi:MAG: hypothetical protein WCA23_04765, partial [Stellaceae bacterium]